MDLQQKGESASLGGIKQFMVSLKWTTAADFDLAAAYKRKDGTTGLVYFGELGDLNSFPFMQLSGDEGVGDQGGDNEETMRVMKIDDHGPDLDTLLGLRGRAGGQTGAFQGERRGGRLD